METARCFASPFLWFRRRSWAYIVKLVGLFDLKIKRKNGGVFSIIDLFVEIGGSGGSRNSGQRLLQQYIKQNLP